jgi:hypothetical protein
VFRRVLCRAGRGSRGDETERPTTRRSGRGPRNGPEGASAERRRSTRSPGETMSQGWRGLAAARSSRRSGTPGELAPPLRWRRCRCPFTSKLRGPGNARGRLRVVPRSREKDCRREVARPGPHWIGVRRRVRQAPPQSRCLSGLTRLGGREIPEVACGVRAIVRRSCRAPRVRWVS